MTRRVCMLLHKSAVHDSRVRRAASALAADGHEVTVVELDAGAHGRLDGFRRVSASPPAWVRRALPFHLYRAVFLVSFVRRLVQLRPEVVHAHDAAMLLPALLGARLTGASVVYDSHELATGVPYRNSAWTRFVALVERIGVPRAKAVITVSDGIADEIRKRYGLRRRPLVVRNTCALPAGRPDGRLRAALGIDGAPMVLHQGAAAEGRGCVTLIHAMAHVDDAVLVFLGDTEPGYGDVLENAASSAGVTDRVRFRPSVELEDLLAATAEADVGVSLLEPTCVNHELALPNKLFEYIAAGVPVVVSRLPEMGRLVRELGVGWTADPSDPEDVADALRRALARRGDPELAARLERAAGELAWERERVRLLDLYRTITAVARAGA